MDATAMDPTAVIKDRETLEAVINEAFEPHRQILDAIIDRLARLDWFQDQRLT